MPYLAYTRSEAPAFPPLAPLNDDTSQLYLAATDVEELYTAPTAASSSSSLASIKSTASRSSKKSGKEGKQEKRNLSLSNASERRSYFTQAKRRREIVFGPEDVLTTDFCYGYLEFNPSLALKLPGGLSIDLMRYWDGQQVRFVCCKRRKPEDPEGEDGMPWGRIFWCVAIELVKDRAQGEGHVGA